MEETKPDIVIFGAGIAGLWTFHSLKKMGYDVLLLEKDSIGCGQTIASQGIIHSGLKFSLAGKVNKLARAMSTMPERWYAALHGEGEVDLSSAKIATKSQQLLIPTGFMGGITRLVTERAFANTVRSVPKDEWSDDIKGSGFKGSVIFMNEPVLNIPTVLRALAEPYRDCIRKITDEQANAPFKFLKDHNISAKKVIFTSAGSNHEIAKNNDHNKGLETQKRPLVQGMMQNAPFPLFAHLIGKTDKPIATITTHEMSDGTLVWYIGGLVAERAIDAPVQDVISAALKAFKTYMPYVDVSNVKWATLPVNRVEGKSKTDSWMPDTPTIHHTEEALYCWPTKLAFAPMFGDMVQDRLKTDNITPSHKTSVYDFLPLAEYTQTPWDKAQWIK